MSEKKQESNRRIARKSTGPKTAADKAMASRNLRCQGILGMRVLREAQAWRLSRLEVNAKRVDDGVA